MPEPFEVLQVPTLGVRVEIRETAGDTGGASETFDVIGQPRGFLTQPHVHAAQTERHEVIEGEMVLAIGRERHLLRAGDAMTVPRGAVHSQLPSPAGGAGRVRVTLAPAGRTAEFLRFVAAMDREGDLTKGGFPKPVAGARMVQRFGDSDHAARPPVAVQRALSKAILAVATNRYEFVDEWDVAAAPEAVFAALADARTYPEWWRPVYIDVDADGPARLGSESRQHFKGRLPYHLRTRSRVTRFEPPRLIGAEVDGDLRGSGLWTLTELPGGRTHVRFDWAVHADRPLLRALTPLLRPALRANHAWAIARARDGLEPYARRTAAAEAAPAEPPPSPAPASGSPAL